MTIESVELGVVSHHSPRLRRQVSGSIRFTSFIHDVQGMNIERYVTVHIAV